MERDDKLKTIILPGYSLRNKDWAEEIKQKLDLGHKVQIHEWKHWTAGNFSLKKELEAVLDEIEKERVNIIAKSVGTRVLMELIPKIPEQINKVILCGIPTRFQSAGSQKNYKNGLSFLKTSQVTIIQNTKDRLSPYEVVEQFIHSHYPKMKMIEKPRSDHSYPFFEDFQKILE